MVQMPPIINEIARDFQLGGRDMQIWIVAVPRLEFVEFREISLAELAAEFEPRISRPAICRALVRLVERGYLERSADAGHRRIGKYRIPLRRIFPPR